MLLGHWNKNVTESAMYRGSGSMDFVNGSRSVLTTGWTAEGKRAAAHVKSNGAPLGDAILFDIVRSGQGWRLIWQGSSASIGADDLFGTPPAGGGAAFAGDMYKALIRAIAQDKKQWSGRGYEALSLARGYGLDADIMTEKGFGRAMREGVPGVQCSFKRVKAGFQYSIILQEDAYEQQVAPGV